jgi:transaldolase
MNPLLELREHGQSFWLDFIERRLITSGGLKRLVEEDGLRGVTSNPTILNKAVSASADYDGQIGEVLAENPDATANDIYERLAVTDIRGACDVLAPIHEESEGLDGYVSLEASPHLAGDTEGTIAEARKLSGLVDRPNLMVKVPATPEGIPAIERLVGEGHNINVTLMFSMAHYEAVAEAYLRGVERARDPGKAASVASFFVSRVDTKVDKKLEEIGCPAALSLRGKVAVANSKLVYRRFREVFGGERFTALSKNGARLQRVLWGSTSTKNPQYSDLLYVESLIGQDTINTMPLATIDAFRDHGQVRTTLDEGLEEAEAVLSHLDDVGIDLSAITQQLQEEGVKAFADDFDRLLGTIAEKSRALPVV